MSFFGQRPVCINSLNGTLQAEVYLLPYAEDEAYVGPLGFPRADLHYPYGFGLDTPLPVREMFRTRKAWGVWEAP